MTASRPLPVDFDVTLTVAAPVLRVSYSCHGPPSAGGQMPLGFNRFSAAVGVPSPEVFGPTGDAG